MVDRKKLIAGSITRLKSGTMWGKVTGVLTVLVLLIQAYYDIREDVQKAQERAQDAQEEVDQTEKNLKKRETLSIKETDEAIADLQEKMQFVYEEGVLLKDQVDDLSLEVRRLQARLGRYHGSPNPLPEGLSEEEVKELALRLLQFLDFGSFVEPDATEMSVEIEGDSWAETEDYSDRAEKKSKHVTEDGQLKFEETRGKTHFPD